MLLMSGGVLSQDLRPVGMLFSLMTVRECRYTPPDVLRAEHRKRIGTVDSMSLLFFDDIALG